MNCLFIPSYSNSVPCSQKIMEQGWDPEIKRFFRKILNTIGAGLAWMMAALTAGVYFGLAYHEKLLYIILFYVGLAVSLGLLLRYYYRMWK